MVRLPVVSFRAIVSLLFLLMASTAAYGTSFYTISFTPVYYSSDPGFTAEGSFGYDPGTGFSDFHVTVDGHSLDLTNAANNASNVDLDHCPSALSGAAYVFEVITTCNTGTYVYGTGDIGFEFQQIEQPSLGFRLFAFGGKSTSNSSGFMRALNYTETYNSAVTDTINFISVLGAFQVTPAPEPASLALTATALIALALTAARQKSYRKILKSRL